FLPLILRKIVTAL
uniref:Crabrolin n=1 Tax=Vespa crabro TaxID=7445 RepID=CRBL_VESCR|nr:RecName: Full=Crabrolin [Vespa crabro]